MQTTPRILIVPGWRDSGPGHWQSLWAEQLPGAERVVQDDWITPHRGAWVQRLEECVLSRPEPVVIVAHSLGCIATTHMGAQAAGQVAGALFVAPADPERRAPLIDFAPVPSASLPYRSVLVASRRLCARLGQRTRAFAERRPCKCRVGTRRLAIGPGPAAIADGRACVVFHTGGHCGPAGLNPVLPGDQRSGAGLYIPKTD